MMTALNQKGGEMKMKLAALVLALLFLSELVMAYGPLSRERPQPPGQSFAISEHGTLLDVFDANGKSRFGPIVSDGFDVSYKTQSRSVSASAIGTNINGLQFELGKSNGEPATAIVETSDKALEITSHFMLDESGKTVIIERRFR